MHIRTLQSLPRPVNVLTTHSAWLFSSLVLGCNGLLSGSRQRDRRPAGAAVPRGAGATTSPRRSALNDRIYPTGARVLRRALGRHAQPHEGGAGAARPAAARGGAPAAGQARRAPRSTASARRWSRRACSTPRRSATRRSAAPRALRARRCRSPLAASHGTRVLDQLRMHQVAQRAGECSRRAASRWRAPDGGRRRERIDAGGIPAHHRGAGDAKAEMPRRRGA